MKIVMTMSVRGSIDGKNVIDMIAGQEYETVDSPVGERLARGHMARGHAMTPEAAADLARIALEEDEVPKVEPRSKARRSKV